jgi:hypothetical protein
MQIFNTKKYRLEWEKKVEESYNKGKIDGLKEALNSIDNCSNNRKSFKRLTEKELLIEIMNNLILNNVRLTKLSDKVNEISLINSKDLNGENSLEHITNTINNISNMLENEFNQDYTNSLSGMLKNIEDKVNCSLDEFGHNNLYAKINSIDVTDDVKMLDDDVFRMDNNIDNMKLQINEINKKLTKIKDVLDESLSEYNASSLYAKLRELK